MAAGQRVPTGRRTVRTSQVKEFSRASLHRAMCNPTPAALYSCWATATLFCPCITFCLYSMTRTLYYHSDARCLRCNLPVPVPVPSKPAPAEKATGSATRAYCAANTLALSCGSVTTAPSRPLAYSAAGPPDCCSCRPPNCLNADIIKLVSLSSLATLASCTTRARAAASACSTAWRKRRAHVRWCAQSSPFTGVGRPPVVITGNLPVM